MSCRPVRNVYLIVRCRVILHAATSEIDAPESPSILIATKLWIRYVGPALWSNVLGPTASCLISTRPWRQDALKAEDSKDAASGVHNYTLN